MTNQSTASQLMDIALRIREMREILGYSIQEMAERTETSEETYRTYEAGTIDLPFTFMHKCAKVFGLELTDLLEGRSARLSGYTVTRKGKGLTTASEDGITIQDMAPMFRKKLATPYWVTYQYSAKLQDKPIHTTTHTGQEFNLIIKGAMRIRVGDHEEILREGDSIFYKTSPPHGMIAIDGHDCIFLSMIMASDTTDKPLYIGQSRKGKPVQKLLCHKFVNAVCVSAAFKFCIHICFYNVGCNFATCYSFPKADDICIVVHFCHSCAERVGNVRSTNAFDFVCRNTHAYTCAAYKNTKFTFA